ncbi:hypothetical protein [Flavobacterium cerinum]|uniref:Uncharacterized protein n=1 Tax=Flavobacterium cerinum TaxID=2502784 RepID=A0ABY5IRT7_9FLAO|nr:hypothetical protein [Flavobacterium cerinum]UUC45567.1 hypothetical protein NOX80_18345 [Flavobacterium cerinum]
MIPEIKGYNLSTDYEMLWNLINSGYRVLGWIVYPRYTESIIFDSVEIKKPDDYYRIGSRGIGYERHKKSKECFIEDCKDLQLKFINLKD